MEKIAKTLKNIRPDVDFAQSKSFGADGLLDSLDVIHLVAELEKDFGITIDGADMLPENFDNIESIQMMIDRLKK